MRVGVIGVVLWIAVVGAAPAAAECGNGIVEADETCDPPGQPAGPLGKPCRSDCTFCGDRVLQSPPEACDQDTVDPSCRTLLCGSDCSAFFIDPCFRGCDPSNADAQSLAEARGEIAAACDCAGATSHGAYVRCARDVVRDRIDHGRLFRGCKRTVMDCAAASTCGKPGAVTCSRTNAGGSSRCSIKSDAARCVPPNGGTACVGTSESCCDGCDAP